MSSPYAPLVLALVLLAPLAKGEDTAAYAPSAVVAVEADGDTLVRWAPGLEPADSYRVYGIASSGPPRLLLEAVAAELAASVPAGFTNYGVSGVRAGIESPLVIATGSVDDGDDCIARIAPPPDPHVIICERYPSLIKVYRPVL